MFSQGSLPFQPSHTPEEQIRIRKHSEVSPGKRRGGSRSPARDPPSARSTPRVNNVSWGALPSTLFLPTLREE